MRIATLAALVMAGIVTVLAMALWPVPRFEEVVTPDAALAALVRGPSSVAPDAAVAAMYRGPISPALSLPIEIPATLPLADATPAVSELRPRTVAAGAASGVTSEPLFDLVTILPNPGTSAPRPLTPSQAIDAAMQSPDFQETVNPLARLYFATFGRYPDYEGLNYYTGQREGGSGLAEIADEFARGREFDMRYGDLSNAEFVARILSNVLGNESQADVRAHWTAELDAGRMTRGQVIVDLAESGMFRERTANQVFVSAAYAEVLRTAPQPAEFSRWVAFLNAGNPQDALINGLLGRR